MTKKHLFSIILAVGACTASHAQEPRLFGIPSTPLSPGDSLSSGSLPANPATPTTPSNLPTSLPDQPAVDARKDKGPTEITAEEATFDQKAHLAIFLTNVVVKDPEFNVVCDKLTAYLKHEDAPKPAAKGGKPTPRPATRTPAPKSGAAGDPAKKSAGGLERAIAEMNPGGRVEITQDKVETDGTTTHSVGHGTKADYNALTGDIVLTGTPDVTKGTDHLEATADYTVITLNRDGRMHAKGPHKTTIVNKGDAGLKPNK